MLLQALCSISEPLVNWNWSYSPETPNLDQIRRFLELCDLEIWRMTLKNNRAPLLGIIKLYTSFHHHMWIQTGVTVRKRLSWVVTSVTLTFDLCPWPFAWTSLLSLVITPENFMMIRWWEHSQKGVTNRQTDGRTDRRTDGLNHSWSCLVAAKNILYTLIDSLSKLWSHSIMHELKDTQSVWHFLYQKNSAIITKLFVLTYWNVSTTNGMVSNCNLINFLPPAQSPLNAPHFTIHNTFALNLKMW